jgi:hypothetical protein
VKAQFFRRRKGGRWKGYIFCLGIKNPMVDILVVFPEREIGVVGVLGDELGIVVIVEVMAFDKFPESVPILNFVDLVMVKEGRYPMQVTAQIHVRQKGFDRNHAEQEYVCKGFHVV